MTTKEVIFKTIEELPEDCLDELADYARMLRLKAAHRKLPTAIASESVLAKDWLRPEEDDAWRDL